MSDFTNLDNELRNAQQAIFKNTSYDDKIKSAYIYDLFDVRKKNARRFSDAKSLKTIQDKEEKFVVSMNRITPQNLNIFAFIGHGWNTSKTFELTGYTNFHVLMYDRQECLTFTEEKGGFRPRDNLKFASSKQSKLRTFIDLNKSAIEHSAGVNDYIHFDSEFNSTVPDMLLTLHGKGSEQNFFHEIGGLVELNTSVMRLSELVAAIAKQRSDKDVVLQIITCRKNITMDQERHISRVFVQTDRKPEASSPPRRTFRRANLPEPIILDVNDQNTKYVDVSAGRDILLKIKDDDLLIRAADLPVVDPPSKPFYI